MQKITPFTGTINIEEDQKNKSLLKFDIGVDKLPIEQTLMASFCEFKFSSQEKKELTQDYRKIIRTYQTIPEEITTEYAHKFLSSLKRVKSGNINIKASDFGTYICLAAIFSGKLPTNKIIIFELEGAPLSIFPKSLIKSSKAVKGIHVTFLTSNKSWLRPFSSLYSCPRYMNFKSNADFTVGNGYSTAA